MENGDEAGCKQAQKDFLRAIHLNPKCIKARVCLAYNLQVIEQNSLSRLCLIKQNNINLICIYLNNTKKVINIK